MKMLPRWLVACALFAVSGLLGAQQSTPGETNQQPPIVRIQLHDTYKQASQQASADLRALHKALPELAPDVDPAKTSPDIYNQLASLGPLLNQCSAVLPGKTPEQARSLLPELEKNPLVASAWVDTPEHVKPEQEATPAHAASRSARNVGDLSGQQYYLQDPVPGTGYVIGGLNSLDARAYPGGDGSQVRLMVSSQFSYWQHPLLPEPHPKLKTPTCWGTDNGFNPVGALLFAGDKGEGVTGMLPHAKGAGAIATDNDLGIVELINGGWVKPGDVILIAQDRGRDNLNEPAGNCKVPEGLPNNVWFRCSLPVPSGRPSTADVHASVIKWATEQHGIHVVINADVNKVVPKQYGYSVNLDDPFYQNRYNRQVNDNGAIYVGAVDPRTGGPYSIGESYHSLATFGSRIDLFGWAEHVFTLATDSIHYPTNYIYVRGPYLAAAMVAGAVAQVQSIAFAAGLGPIPPKHMRDVLVETGHPLPHPDPAHPLGVMPDVVAAADKLLEEHEASPPEASFEATLHGPDVVTMGKPNLFWVSTQAAGEYSYAWTRPDDFTGDVPGIDKVTLTASQKPNEYLGVLKVTVTKKGQQPITLTKPVLVALPTLEGMLAGDDRLASGTAGVFTAHVDNAPSDKPLRYMWNLPSGFTANALNTAQIKITAPKVEADTVAKFSVIVQTSASDAITLHKDVVITAPQSAHASISGPATVAAGQSIHLSGTLSGAPAPHNYTWLAEHFKPVARSGQNVEFNAPDAPGSYQVSLTAYGTDGKPVTALHTVTVTSPTGGDASEPITGQLNIPTVVHPGQLFTISIKAHSATGRPLKYDWRWMGDGDEPKGPKFRSMSEAGKDTMQVRISDEVKQDINAYIRVIVSDGVNEKIFRQDVLIKVNGGQP
jgi:hypothetical protein